MAENLRKTRTVPWTHGIGILLIAAARAHAQAASLESFEVASVKRLTERSTLHFEVTPTSLIARSVPLGYCIRWAYGLRLEQRYQMVGPDWMEFGAESVRYDIAAKSAVPVTSAQMRLLMRSLLADRWKLSLHRETRVMPVYVLSVAKGGPKLHMSEKVGDKKIASVVTGGVECDGCSMADLAEILERPAGALIVEETGLEGRYDFSLDCEKYKDYAVAILGSTQADFGPACDQSIRPLGLKLEMQKRPIEVVVIDHAEKTPTEN